MINEEIEQLIEKRDKEIEDIRDIVGQTYNKLVGKEICKRYSKKSTITGTRYDTRSPNEFDLSCKTPSNKDLRKWAKILYEYKNDTNKFFFYVLPCKVDEIRNLCKKNGYLRVTKEEMVVYKRKDKQGWTKFLPMADTSLGKFHKLTVKLNIGKKRFFLRKRELFLVGLGVIGGFIGGFIERFIPLTFTFLKESYNLILMSIHKLY